MYNSGIKLADIRITRNIAILVENLSTILKIHKDVIAGPDTAY